MTEELKPCPGCGQNHTRVIGGPGTAGGPKYWAGCDFCHWRTWGDTALEAIAAWNQRANAGAVDELVEPVDPHVDFMADVCAALGFAPLYVERIRSGELSKAGEIAKGLALLRARCPNLGEG